LSYQYAGKTNNGTWSEIIHTDGAKRKHRLRLQDLIGQAIEARSGASVPSTQSPNIVCATAHFSRADLSSFRDYSLLKARFDNIRGTYVTLGQPYRCRYTDRNNHSRQLTIYLRDTATISLSGSNRTTPPPNT